MNKDLIADIDDFRNKYGFNEIKPTFEDLCFRLDLMQEEVGELKHAMRTSNSEEIVDAYIDIIYIALGSLRMIGVDINEAWHRVHAANMSKVRGIKPGREQSNGVDVYKPEDWQEPNHKDNLGCLPELLS